MEANEVTIGKLYAAYANKYRQLEDFWNSLESEEVKHARWIKELTQKIILGELLTAKRIRFNAVAIKTFSDNIKNELNRVNNGAVPIIEALATTVSIEQSLLENRFFEVFESDSGKFKEVLQKIGNDTQNHVRQAEKTLEKFKGSVN